MSLDAFASTYLPQVDGYLAAMLRQGGGPVAAFYGMMQYHFGWMDAHLRPVRSNAGKRLRPLVCLLACQTAGGAPEHALPAACALELVHSFSLVHDDIQDGSRMRRGRPAVWDVWGQPQAINVGDALFALARLAILQLPKMGVPSERALAAAVALDSACLALCEGQYLDMSFETRPGVSLDEYMQMIRLKTAALLAASAQIGALVATQDERTVTALREFGEKLGLAFQVQDDLLGIWGREDVTGKPASTDLRTKKKTLPILHALGVLPGAERLSTLFGGTGPLEGEAYAEAMGILDQAGSRPHAEATAADCLEAALESLEQAGMRHPGVDDLAELAKSLVGRSS